MSVKIKSIGGKIPQWKNHGDAGLDLHASESMIIMPGKRVMIPLGIQTEFPPNYVAVIKDRSGLALEGLYTHAGVIDSSYRGEWKVIVENAGDISIEIEKGDRVAQVLFLPCFHLIIQEVEQLSVSEREKGGFGSSGRH
ncbi:MAG: dUTP diphosphatase [Euryarchaeota archaeon]|nr:dUTP diphosphatase [Euryarchaeota archaeon]